jgi:hypothetical protein
MSSALKLKLFKSLVLQFFSYGDVLLLMASEESLGQLRRARHTFGLSFVSVLRVSSQCFHVSPSEKSGA